MQNPSPASGPYGADMIVENDDTDSPLSWAAIIGGAFASIALSFILIGLGVGVGVAFNPLGPHEAGMITHIGIATTIWLILVQWISSGLGGFLTGRLRTKWSGVHNHEVFFRDTAHGFLTWAVATVAGAVLLLITAVGAHGGMKHGMQHQSGPSAYYIDSLFRADHAVAPVDADTKAEATAIIMKGVKDGSLSDDDKTYLGQMIAAHSGGGEPDAEKKISDMVAKGHAQAEQARKAAGSFAIFSFLSMLIGAFIACVAAAIGGQERDMPHPKGL